MNSNYSEAEDIPKLWDDLDVVDRCSSLWKHLALTKCAQIIALAFWTFASWLKIMQLKCCFTASNSSTLFFKSFNSVSFLTLPTMWSLQSRINTTTWGSSSHITNTFKRGIHLVLASSPTQSDPTQMYCCPWHHFSVSLVGFLVIHIKWSN